MNLTDVTEIKSVMARFGKNFSKSLGQNFLINSGVIDSIIAGSGVTPQTPVLEIGPGIGVLTSALAGHARCVTAVEIDAKLLPVLDYTLAGLTNINIVHDDIMKIDIPALCREQFGQEKAMVVANLPYYITTPLLMRLLEHRECFSSITVMVQKEVAERMAAQAGQKAYASLSVAVQYRTKPTLLTIVPPHDFMPPPKVSSAVIRLDVLDKPSVTPCDETMFFRVVHASFAQRRKTFVNGIANGGLGISKQQAADALDQMKLDADIRGEKLSLEQFTQFTDIIYKQNR